jgi:hypothetical protein
MGKAIGREVDEWAPTLTARSGLAQADVHWGERIPAAGRGKIPQSCSITRSRRSIMATNEIQHLDHDPLAHLEADAALSGLARHQALSGCFALVGPIQICYSWNGAEMDLCLQVGGIKVSCVQVNTSNPCAQLEGNAVFGKASIKVCLQDSCLTYEGTACYRLNPFGDWTCTSAKGTIICF